MTRPIATLCLAAALVAGGCGGDDGGGDTSPPPQQSPAGAEGRQLFATTCGGCHTLAAAETSGTVGPDLDDVKPDAGAVREAIAEGPGIMPENLLEGAEADQVAEFVASSAGG